MNQPWSEIFPRPGNGTGVKESQSGVKITPASPKETKQIARMLGQQLLTALPGSERAIVVALYGGLGSGKTTFVQGLAQGLGIKENITSPTFVLIAQLSIPNSQGNFYHIDPYRLKNGKAIKELKKLGIKEIFNTPQTVAAVEWADRLEGLLPKGRINVHLEHAGENKRNLLIQQSKRTQKSKVNQRSAIS